MHYMGSNLILTRPAQSSWGDGGQGYCLTLYKDVVMWDLKMYTLGYVYFLYASLTGQREKWCSVTWTRCVQWLWVKK